MHLFYRLAADAVVVVHCAYVAFVVVGLVAILIGLAGRRRWARNLVFRMLHLLAIAVVAGEAVCGITCPLTTWEQRLRTLAGQASYQGDFLATWVHELLFYDAAPWVYTVCYAAFALVVLATFLVAPPRWPSRAA
jgi:polyferredoxin